MPQQAAGTLFSIRREPQAVRTPFVLRMSLTETGTPASGPSVSPFLRERSIASACARAWSAQTVTKALSFGCSLSMLARHSSMISRAQTSPARTRRAVSAAVGNRLDSRAMPPRLRRAKRANPSVRELRLPLWSRPGYLIRRLHQIHCALFLEECKASQLTPVQYGLLTALSLHGALDQVSLAEELGLDRATTAEVLARLEARKLIARKANPRDRRAKLASITRRGRTLTVAMFTSMQRAQDRLCAPLSQKERDVFMATLVRLIEVNNAYGRGALRMD